MADRSDLEFTYSLIDRIFRLSLGELADFSGARYEPQMADSTREALVEGWHEALERASGNR